MWLTAGSMSRTRSGHFSLRSIIENPVRLPPGLRKLVTRPEPTGSPDMNTMGVPGAARSVALVAGVPHTSMTSSLRCAISAARSSSRSVLLPPKRYSIEMFFPST